MKDESHKLIELLKRGDNTVAANLMNKHRGVINAYIVAKGGEGDQTQDVLQEGLMRLLLRIKDPDFEGIDNIDGYFINICKNVWRKYLQYLTRHQQYIADSMTEPTEDEETILEGQESDVDKKLKMIRKSLTKLPEECQQLIIMWMHGYSSENIMGLLNFSNEGTVRNRKYLCLKSLKKLLKR